MKYWFINFEEEQYWIEVASNKIATRQIIKEADHIIRISCIEDCLAEGVIDIEDLDGEIREISLEEFEGKWSKETKTYHKLWEFRKEKYPIGKIVEGEIKYIYPQGIIIQSDDIKGVYQDIELNESKKYIKYPLDIIKGRVKGYDDKNMWLIISPL